MTEPKTLLIRADADPQIGTGHVMRCLALAQACRDGGGKATFLTAVLPALRARLEAEGFRTELPAAEAGSAEDARQTAELAGRSAAWVVVDGYRFGEDFQRRLKESGRLFLLIDDYGHSSSYSASMILNQNQYASEKLYARREPDTRLLLGADYVLLRREFLKERPEGRGFPEKARKVLVTMGGVDAPDATGKVLRSLEAARDLEVTVLVGGGNPRFEELSSLARGMKASVRVEKDVTDMPGWMRWADLAVYAAGTTSYEMAFMGVPGLTVVLAENQRGIAEEFSARGLSANLGWHADAAPSTIASAVAALLASPQDRARMSGAGRALVDGRGAQRVLNALAGRV